MDKADQAAIDGAVEGAIENLRAAVKKLDALGARFIVVGTRTPRPVLSDHDRASEEPNVEARNDAAGRELNIAIQRMAREFDGELAADVAIFDFYADIRDVTTLAETLGFSAYSSDLAKYCTAKGQADDCGKLINYDSADKTSAVHAILADRFIQQFGLRSE